jgi:hypothetical protein
VFTRPALVLGLLLVGSAGHSAAQTATPDPWTRVPATPSTYFTDDGFVDRVSQAYDVLVSDIEKQSKINNELKKTYGQMDITQKMQRLQAFMTKNPQEAAKVMQAMQTAGTDINTGATSGNTANVRLTQELPSVKANFSAALEKALKPIQMRQEEMLKTRTEAINEGSDHRFKTAADLAQYTVLIQQENSEYEKVCASFFGPKGAFTNWLASYKEEVVKKMIAAGETNDSALVSQMAIMDSPTGGYRSTAGLEGVRDYLNKVKDVYSSRRRKKVPPTA